MPLQRLSPRSISMPTLLAGTALALALLIAPTAAAVQPKVESSVEQPARRPLLFPPRIGKKANAERKRQELETAATEESEAPPAADEQINAAAEGSVERIVAVEPSTDGVWDFVDQMGEAPTDDQVDAIEERAAAELSEKALIDELSNGEPPMEYYNDPVAVLSADPLFLDDVDPSEFDIPIVVNPDVERWVKYFTGNGRKYYKKWLGRSTRYRPMMHAKLAEKGLPADLVYLSMIESGYNAHAYSHAAAAGLWQFIPSTARLYKMRVDWWVDDRRDPEASLDAAMAFLGELHQMFGKWELAWAAYNTGPGRVRRAMKKSGTDDFWTIENGNYLHPETENYVPKIMAAAIIGKHPERYGFTDIEFQDELLYDTAEVSGSVEIEVLARCAGVSAKEIKALNPALRRFATPPEGYEMRLPTGSKDQFVAALAKVPKSKRVTVAHHKVRRGETVGAIASKYGVAVSDITRANGLKNANRVYVGQSLLIPGRSGSSTHVAAISSNTRTDARAVPTTHTVRGGDTLSGIASRYGTSVADIQRRNSISGSKIVVGQRLRLSGSAAKATSSTKYTVRSGDSLSKIASRYGVRTSDLQRWNGISNASSIQVGQVLKIKGGSASSTSSYKSYKVVSGDSLGKIAQRHGCSVKQIQSWNGLRSTVIQPGQQLKIKR